MISKLFNALKRSRSGIARTLRLIAGKSPSPEEIETLEEALLQSDMGYDVVQDIIGLLETSSSEDLMDAVRDELVNRLPQDHDPALSGGPFAMLVIGVNGSGKTTSAAKLANLYKQMGLSVTLVAADTYRAAAIEQLKIWSERVDCRLICNDETTEPVSVIFDGLESARANKSDLVIIDTAGRLHTSQGLMKELDKMYKVIEARFSDFKIYSLITLDATMGQNSLSQAKEFQSDRKLDGALLSKLDGTAKGGIIFPLYGELDIPVKFVGVGEQLSDLEVFERETYVDGLLGLGD
jgi:fused signal recognition particle receptor